VKSEKADLAYLKKTHFKKKFIFFLVYLQQNFIIFLFFFHFYFNLFGDAG